MIVPDKVIGRLSVYRRILKNLKDNVSRNYYSYELASMAGVTAAQFRRDIMNIGYSGDPNRGYNIIELLKSLGHFLDAPGGQRAALVGVGNLGRAILTHFSGRHPKLSINACFDTDPQKCGSTITSVRCHSLDKLSDIIHEQSISIGIITVPAGEAQKVADMLVSAGVKGLLNFAPVPVSVPPGVYVEDIDMTMAMEKVAFFSRTQV